MGVLNDIREQIQEIARQDSEAATPWHLGEVKAVASDGETCDVEIDGTTWTDVRLTAVVDGSCDVKLFPKVGSMVMVADLSNGPMNDLAVVLFSQFEKVEIGEAKHTTANADTLRQELEKLTRRVDTIYDAIQNATPTPQDGGAGLKSTMVATLATATDKESWDDIEDDKIKH